MQHTALGDQPHATPHETIAISRRCSADLIEGTRREWLATTGSGDYAIGTTALLATRRYHGLLVGAMRAPIGRRMLVPFIDETVTIGRQEYALASRRWSDGSVEPDGHRSILGFALEGGIPAWTFELGSTRLEKRIIMLRDERAVVVLWTLAEGSEPITLDARVFVEHRGQHQLDPDASWVPSVSAHLESGVHARIELPANRFAADPTTLHVAAQGATLTPAASWWRRHALSEERARGYDAQGSACHALTASFTLAPGETRAIIIGLSPKISETTCDPNTLLAHERARRSTLLERADLIGAESELISLCLAADHFIVRRARKDGSEGRSIIAGFPWFEDWGRDAMLALPGLLLRTGRADDAQLVLSTFLDHLSDGLLPNRFPDETSEPEYHSADAPLLAIVSAVRTFECSADRAWFASIWPQLITIIDAYAAGTRHGISIDSDGLVHAGDLGLQLTWMDAKVGENVVTPRRGKPIELSALWLDALHGLLRAVELGHTATADELDRIKARAASATRSMGRFWNPQTNCFFDVLDGPEGDDASVRPNQLFALAPSWQSIIDAEWTAKALAKVAKELATPLAVRTLTPLTSGYRGRYEGDQRSRDNAYHNGTAWPFLAGIRLKAEYLHDAQRGRHLARIMLADLSGQLRDGGIGSVSEVCDGDAPHDSRGCPMQAWSVGCLLDALCVALNRGGAEKESNS